MGGWGPRGGRAEEAEDRHRVGLGTGETGLQKEGRKETVSNPSHPSS